VQRHARRLDLTLRPVVLLNGAVCEAQLLQSPFMPTIQSGRRPLGDQQRKQIASLWGMSAKVDVGRGNSHTIHGKTFQSAIQPKPPACDNQCLAVGDDSDPAHSICTAMTQPANLKCPSSNYAVVFQLIKLLSASSTPGNRHLCACRSPQLGSG
jgi:hypothetical protein